MTPEPHPEERPPTAAELGQDADDLLGIIRLLPDVIFRCEKREDGRIYWTLNEGKLAEEFGLTTAEIEGVPLEELFPGGASDPVVESFERAFAGEAHEFVNEMGGRYFKHFPQPVFDDDGNVKEVVGFITEVTQVKRAEKERARHEELERLTFVTSHSLQQPLRMVGMYAQLLEKRLGEDGHLDEELGEFLSYLSNGVEEVKALVDDLRIYSEVSREEHRGSVADPNAILQDVEQEMADEIQIMEAQVEATDLPRVAMRSKHVHLLLHHLVENALRFAGDEPPRVHVTGDRVSDELVELRVRDEGVGIPPKHHDRIFNLFERLGPSDDPQATGIGLALCHRIVDRYDGSIHVDSAPGKGTTMVVRLPGAPPEGAPGA